MSFSTIMRLLWLRDIHNATGPRNLTTESFLTSRNTTINSPANSGKFTGYISNPKKSIQYYSHEADRFASAAFESIGATGAEPLHPRSIAWPLIKSYYAAFFALHALIRIHGWACTRLTGDTVQIFNKQLGALYPDAPKIAGGIYLIRSESGGAELTFEKLEGGASGGSHEGLWSLLDAYIDEIIISALSNNNIDPTETAVTIDTLNRFKAFIEIKGGAIWFTQVRNRINYSHSYGAWHPYSGSTCDLERIKQRITEWRSPPENSIPNQGDDETLQFATACTFLVSMCKTSVSDLKLRAARQSPFKKNCGMFV